MAQTTNPDRNITYTYNARDQRTAVNNGITITENTPDNLDEVLSTQVTTAPVPPPAAGGASAKR